LGITLVGANLKSIDLKTKEAPPESMKDINAQKNAILNMYRAFVCKQVLMDEYNWTQITMTNPKFISEFFDKLLQALHILRPKTNVFLIVDIIEVFLKRDAEQTIANIIQYNIPYVLLWNTQHAKVRELLINLVNLPNNYFKIESISVTKLAIYLKHTNFFLDYLNLMLDKNYQFDTAKLESDYKPEALKKIYEANEKLLEKLTSKANKIKKQPSVCAISPLHFERKSIQNPSLLVEERLKLHVDIDRIMDGALKDTKKLSQFHFMNSSQNSQKLDSHRERLVVKPQLERSDSITSISKQITKIYPSMLDSLKKEEEAVKSKDITSLRRLSIDHRKRSVIDSIRQQNVSTSPSKRIKSIPSQIDRTPMRSDRTPMRAERSPIKNSMKSLIVAEENSPLLRINTIVQNNKSITSVAREEKRTDSLTSLKGKNELKSLPTASDMLKNLHPDVKQKVFLAHFRDNSAHLTQAILNSNAFPSKALVKKALLPVIPGLVGKTNLLEGIEKLAHAKPFTPRSVREAEVQAYQFATVVDDMMQIYFDNYKQTDLMSKIGTKNSAELKLIQCLQGTQGPLFFNLLLKVNSERSYY